MREMQGQCPVGLPIDPSCGGSRRRGRWIVRHEVDLDVGAW